VATGWTLVHFVWQAAVVAAALAFSRALAPRSDPRVRYAMACAALAACALLAISTFISTWAALPAAGGDVLVARGAAPFPPAPAALVPSLMPWLLAAWASGVTLLALRSAIAWARLTRMVRHRSASLEPDWLQRIDTLRRRVGIAASVRVRTAQELAAPIVTGCLRPTVLLPLSALTGLPAADLEALILHELFHIQRRDLWVHRAQLVLETLFFYHPAIWWISSKVNAEREYCCDAAVVSVTRDRLGYARALTRMESLRSRLPQPALAVTGGPLMSRIRTIIQPSGRTGKPVLSTMGTGIAALGLVALLLAGTVVVGEVAQGRTPAWMPDSVTQWNQWFEEAAERHGVDPALLSVITWVESHGNADAVSSWGATGLMQIMPATAERIAEVRKLDDFELEDLRDPATNIDFGAWYLAQQIQEFGDGELSKTTVLRAAAAYNAGENQMRRHLEDGEPLSKESRRYAQLVSALWQDRNEEKSEAFDLQYGHAR
jgi:beta-lactamase regulating signal transducer with metallopeptidase domain